MYKKGLEDKYKDFEFEVGFDEYKVITEAEYVQSRINEETQDGYVLKIQANIGFGSVLYIGVYDTAHQLFRRSVERFMKPVRARIKCVVDEVRINGETVSVKELTDILRRKIGSDRVKITNMNKAPTGITRDEFTTVSNTFYVCDYVKKVVSIEQLADIITQIYSTHGGENIITKWYIMIQYKDKNGNEGKFFINYKPVM